MLIEFCVRYEIASNEKASTHFGVIVESAPRPYQLKAAPVQTQAAGSKSDLPKSFTGSHLY